MKNPGHALDYKVAYRDGHRDQTSSSRYILTRACVYARRIMFTNLRGVFRKRVTEWYYVWTQIQEFPTLTAAGIRIVLKVFSAV